MVDMNVEDDFGEGCRGNMHEYYMTTTMKKNKNVSDKTMASKCNVD